MAIRITMEGSDAINSSEGRCYITYNGNRYNFSNLIDLSVEVEITKQTIKVLGSRTPKYKYGGWVGSGEITFYYYNSPLFRDMFMEYASGGTIPQFDIMVVNEDSTSSSGEKIIVFKKCVIEGTTLLKLGKSNEEIEEDIKFSFEDIEYVKEFNS